jgi:hypothetical protein
MAEARTLARLDTWIWALIFGGLFGLTLGIATHDEAASIGWGLGILGGLAAAVGFVLIFVRARLTDAAAASAQSHPDKKPEKQS